MDDEKVKVLFEDAETSLKAAKGQLYQPAEDVVTYSVCVFARNALYHFMSCLYLIYSQDKEEKLDDAPTLEQMIDYCSRYNDKLKSMDFSSVNCKCRDLSSVDDDEIFYCNDVFQVKQCTDLAESVRDMVMEHA